MMTHHIDTHDDVALRDEEIIAFWAMAHNADDDRVPCNTTSMRNTSGPRCQSEAEWAYRCQCGRQLQHCTAHRIVADFPGYKHACGECWTLLPAPIPWLPM